MVVISARHFGTVWDRRLIPSARSFCVCMVSNGHSSQS